MNWKNMIFPLIPFALGIILKTLLDFNLAITLVKYLHKIPVRTIFRINVPDISGDWNQVWDNKTSLTFIVENDRKSTITIKQFGKFFYCEFTSLDVRYYVFGEVINRHLVGKWADKKGYLGYYGAFELSIIDDKNIKGTWLGHSNKDPNTINANAWTWSR